MNLSIYYSFTHPYFHLSINHPSFHSCHHPTTHISSPLSSLLPSIHSPIHFSDRIKYAHSFISLFILFNQYISYYILWARQPACHMPHSCTYPILPPSTANPSVYPIIPQYCFHITTPTYSSFAHSCTVTIRLFHIESASLFSSVFTITATLTKLARQPIRSSNHSCRCNVIPSQLYSLFIPSVIILACTAVHSLDFPFSPFISVTPIHISELSVLLIHIHVITHQLISCLIQNFLLCPSVISFIRPLII